MPGESQARSVSELPTKAEPIAPAQTAGMGRVVFVMPRCRYDHVRAVHKQAYSLRQECYDVVLIVKESDIDEYLGMQVISASAPFGTVLRPFLNLPSLIRQAINLRGDIYVLRNPDTIPLAIALTLFRRNVIYDTHEDFSRRPLIRDAYPKWIRPAIASIITALERLLARITTGVLVTQAQQLETIGGKTFFQPNAPLSRGPIIDAAFSVDVEPLRDKLSLIYVGEISEQRGILSMLELVAEINEQFSCELKLVGWFLSEHTKKQASRHEGWQYVNYFGRLSHAETLAHIRVADIGLAILYPVADYPTTSVTKLFEYMQFGVPFVASNFPAWQVTTPTGAAGLYVNPESAADILRATQKLASNAGLRRRLGSAGKQFVKAEFNWEAISRPFVSIVNESLPRKSSSNCDPR